MVIVIIITNMRGAGQMLAIVRVYGRVEDIGGVGGRIDGGAMRWRRRGGRYGGMVGGLDTRRGDVGGGHRRMIRVIT
jgi:hypothetical protein